MRPPRGFRIVFWGLWPANDTSLLSLWRDMCILMHTCFRCGLQSGVMCGCIWNSYVWPRFWKSRCWNTSSAANHAHKNNLFRFGTFFCDFKLLQGSGEGLMVQLFTCLERTHRLIRLDPWWGSSQNMSRTKHYNPPNLNHVLNITSTVMQTHAYPCTKYTGGAWCAKAVLSAHCSEATTK